MFKQLLRKLLTFYASNIIYGKYCYGEVCCCGASLEDHSVLDNHSPRDLKEYMVTCWVDNKMCK